MTDIPKNTSTTRTEDTVSDRVISTLPNTKGSFDSSAIAWIENHEEGRGGSVHDESKKLNGEIDAAWAALDLLVEDDFPELEVYDRSVNTASASTLQSHLKGQSQSQYHPQQGLSLVVKRLRQPQYWGAIAAMLLVALLLPMTYMGVPVDYVVNKGQQDTVTFKDGTRIELGSNAWVSVREGWGQRSVTLERGNAFFTVTPNKDKPFTIQAGTSTVTVLGTVFSVYRKQQHVEVVVESGKVNVMDDSNNHRLPVDVDLIKNQKATLKQDVAVEVLSNVNVNDAIAWRRGFINFKQAPLATIVDRMNDFYNTPIYIRNSKSRDLLLSGVFKTDDLDSFLVGLQEIAEVNVERNPGGAIYLY